MKTPELETISIFSKDLTLNLTINQISKQLNKSYAFTNKYIRDFLDGGILSKKIVGSAILCSLNYSNEKTLGLLMLNSIDDKMNYVSKSNSKTLQTIALLKSAPTTRSVFLKDNKTYIICDEKESVETYIKKFSKQISLKQSDIILLNPNEFQLNVKDLELKKIIIMEGYETFWKLISDVML
jgi:hypothetical protein